MDTTSDDTIVVPSTSEAWGAYLSPPVASGASPACSDVVDCAARAKAVMTERLGLTSAASAAIAKDAAKRLVAGLFGEEECPCGGPTGHSTTATPLVGDAGFLGLADVPTDSTAPAAVRCFDGSRDVEVPGGDIGTCLQPAGLGGNVLSPDDLIERPDSIVAGLASGKVMDSAVMVALGKLVPEDELKAPMNLWVWAAAYHYASSDVKALIREYIVLRHRRCARFLTSLASRGVTDAPPVTVQLVSGTVTRVVHAVRSQHGGDAELRVEVGTAGGDLVFSVDVCVAGPTPILPLVTRSRSLCRASCVARAYICDPLHTTPCVLYHGSPGPDGTPPAIP